MLGMSKANGADARHGRSGLRPRHWAQAQAENPLARFIPFSSLVSPHDVITRGGDYLRVWRLDGVAFECADEHQIGERHEALCSLLRNLAGGQWAVWTHRLHRVVSDSLQDPAQAGFARDLSQAYQAKLGERRMMSNELYLTLVYRPNVPGPAVDAAHPCRHRGSPGRGPSRHGRAHGLGRPRATRLRP